MNKQLTPRLVYVVRNLLHNFYQKVGYRLDSQQPD